MPSTMIEVVERSTEPIVLARCARRSDSSGPATAIRLSGTRSFSGRSMVGTPASAVVVVSRVIVRFTRYRTSNATTTISRILIGFAINQSAELASQSLWVRS
jgi:hypothetical protein